MTQNQRLAQQQAILIDLLRQVLTKLDVLTEKPRSTSPYYDTTTYGDFQWLCQLCPNIPPSTLRKKSAQGAIPGYRKLGNRVLYHRQQTIDWIEGQGAGRSPDI